MAKHPSPHIAWHRMFQLLFPRGRSESGSPHVPETGVGPALRHPGCAACTGRTGVARGGRALSHSLFSPGDCHPSLFSRRVSPHLGLSRRPVSVHGPLPPRAASWVERGGCSLAKLPPRTLSPGGKRSSS